MSNPFRSARVARVALATLCAAGLLATELAHADDAADREARVAKRMAAVKDQTARLRVFLQQMPKGGDLHNHLVGSVYAEDFMRWADEDNYCVKLDDKGLVAPPCKAGEVSAHGLSQKDPALYEQAIDAMSMRNFVPGVGYLSGHDRFFSVFGKFMPLAATRLGDTVVATLRQAAQDHVGYVELMVNPSNAYVFAPKVAKMPWTPGDYAADYARIEGQLPQLVAEARAEFDAADALVRRELHCGTPQADEACRVQYRYLSYVDRAQPQPFAFAEMALGYAVVQADPRFVGINIVDPEDNPTALADYRVHMDMFRFFSQRAPQVKKTLHAGELTLGLVPQADLRFHIRDAVAAGALRIGHGVDIAYEDDAPALLAKMAHDHIAVEINLTSNDVILGVKGHDHPLQLYLHAGVPVVLSTDDEGVSRSDMTYEYIRAVQEQGLDYPTLKQIARNGLSYAFIAGDSLWQADGHTPVKVCASSLKTLHADAGCAAFLRDNDKARLQWLQERDSAVFETNVLKQKF
ncbi:adenosine deaminase family protein [Solimonas marina]|uniref:adenosine deaminase n=1 Tax=Solimonas marina TaxID=2714601 RepID=A0A970BBB6_9GAMM|nr:adenosine deaminase [Solimonas marina]NKF24231.1 adenosine deaminase [Solimonas marina]